MKQYNVFLDTQVFCKANYNFNGGSLNNLKRLCDDGTAKLFTNDIVIRETERHIKEDVIELARKAKNAIKKQGKLFNALDSKEYDAIESVLMNAPENLLSQYKKYIEDAIILSNHDLSIEELFNSYFNETAPFEDREKKKSEFPDAVIIMSIKKYLKENPGISLHIVTEDNGWHNALSNIPCVEIYDNLSVLLSKIAQTKRLYFQIFNKMGDFTTQLRRQSEKWAEEQDWRDAVDDIHTSLECTDINSMLVTGINVGPEDIEYISENNNDIIVGFSGSISLHVDFSYTDHSHEIYDREDKVWLYTIFGEGESDIEISFYGTLNVSIDENKNMDFEWPIFDELNIGEPEILEYQLSPDSDNAFALN